MWRWFLSIILGNARIIIPWLGEVYWEENDIPKTTCTEGYHSWLQGERSSCFMDSGSGFISPCWEPDTIPSPSTVLPTRNPIRGPRIASISCSLGRVPGCSAAALHPPSDLWGLSSHLMPRKLRPNKTKSWGTGAWIDMSFSQVQVLRPHYVA